MAKLAQAVDFRCIGMSQYQEYLIAIVHVIVEFIAIIRTYAIYGSSRRILALLIAAGAALLGYGAHAIAIHQQTPFAITDLPAAGCLLPTTPDLSPRLADTWTGLLCFDVLIFLLTVYKTLSEKRQSFGILTVMLRDGTMYFGVMALASTSVIVTFRVLPAYLQGLTAPLASVLATTLISRLMLNIRSPSLNYAPEDLKRSAISQLVFEIGVNTTNAHRQDKSEGIDYREREVELDVV
ncbi:hypothetical protein CVT26_000488 [Gymnopilus dilepis]|uniref:Uncharacterized protein n=1 Tax=Gymnopilus dilepis TaxID=231916 RepID=A0A409VH13_9AGAR|nr:hypothetical protein CVT26_000488 [Gymnopilus dilepis]